MNRRLILLACLAAVLVLFVGCPSKAKVPPQPPILPPEEPVQPKAEEPPPPPPPPPAPRAELRTIHFDFDKYDIRPGDAAILEGNAAYLKSAPNVKVTLEGYCDPIGTEEYNRGLGLRRANAAKAYLEKLGIASDRMSVISYGEERLVTTNPAEYELNRRVEFKER